MSWENQPVFLTLEKTQDTLWFWNESDEVWKQTINNLLNVSTHLAYKLWITPDQESRILELVQQNSLQTIKESNYIATLQNEWITNSMIILTLLAQQDELSVITIQWLIKENLIEKLNETTFIKLLDFPFGIKLIQSVFAWKTLQQLSIELQKTLLENQEFTRQELKKQYKHHLTYLTPLAWWTIPKPIHEEAWEHNEISLFNTLWSNAIAALFERWMDEIVWDNIDLFEIDSSIKPFLLELKHEPTFEQSMKIMAEKFEQQIVHISKKTITEKHQTSIEAIFEQFKRSSTFIRKVIKNAKKGVFGDLKQEENNPDFGVWCMIPFLFTIWRSIYNVTNDNFSWYTILQIVTFFLTINIIRSLYRSVEKRNDINTQDSLAKITRREFREKDTSILESDIDALLKNILPWSPEYNEIRKFKSVIKELSSTQKEVTVSPSMASLYQNNPTLFFKHELQWTIDWPALLSQYLTKVTLTTEKEFEKYCVITKWLLNNTANEEAKNRIKSTLFKNWYAFINKHYFPLLKNMDTVNSFTTYFSDPVKHIWAHVSFSVWEDYNPYADTEYYKTLMTWYEKVIYNIINKVENLCWLEDLLHNTTLFDNYISYIQRRTVYKDEQIGYDVITKNVSEHVNKVAIEKLQKAIDSKTIQLCDTEWKTREDYNWIISFFTEKITEKKPLEAK